MTKFEFYRGQRVLVMRGEYEGQHGKISTGEKLPRGTVDKYLVDLDDGDSVEILKGDLKLERLTDDQILEVIKRIKERITQVPEHHIELLKKALLSQDKLGASRECNYIKNHIPSNETESTRIDFEKIDWAIEIISFVQKTLTS